jgi:hypothetical protein
MRRYHPEQGIRDEAQIRMPYPVSNPTDQQFRDAGWLPVVEADPVPAGMVSPDGVTGSVEGGVYVERHVRLITQAVHEAEQATTAATRLAASVRDYGRHVARLQALLARIGLSIPTDRPAVTECVTALLDRGNTDAGVVGLLLDAQYDLLAPVADDIRAIWDIVRAQPEVRNP